MSLPELLTAKSKGVNFKPEVVIDIGANRGSWTRTLLGHFPEAKVLLIEASSKHTRSLKKLKITYSNQTDYRIAVLSETSGQQVDFFESGDTGNSMFREQTESYTNAEPTKRETSTLDDLVASSFISQTSINLVKIDVQGAELMVLRGATRVLSRRPLSNWNTQLSNTIKEVLATGRWMPICVKRVMPCSTFGISTTHQACLERRGWDNTISCI